MLCQGFIVNIGLQVLPQGNGKAFLVYKKAFAGCFQIMDGHGLGLAQMLAVGHGFVGFIGDIGFKIFSVYLKAHKSVTLSQPNCQRN